MTTLDRDPADASEPSRPAPSLVRRLTRAVLGLVIAGALAQVVMSAFYLAVAHSPTPHEVPVGLVAPSQVFSQVQAQVEAGDHFKVQAFATKASLVTAIRDKKIYGGVDLSGTPAHLYVASAAGTSAATTLRTAFTQVVYERTQQQVAKLTASGAPVPGAEVEALAAPPAITDVVALPKNDSVGASIALLVQSIALGATIASMGLGKIGGKTTPSLRRAAGHLVSLAVYAVVSAGAVLAAAHAFGVVPSGSDARLFFSFALLSLAITGSVAGLVTLIGAQGAFLGSAYFLFGIPIAGGSVLPPFMPTAARIVGQALPTGSGVTLVRESLYFPHASVAGPIWVLAAYALVGAALIVFGNGFARRVGRRQVLPLPAH